MFRQTRTRQHLSRQTATAAVLAAAFLLGGCGAPAAGTLTAVSLPAKAPLTQAAPAVTAQAAAAPTVTLTRGAAPAHAERVESALPTLGRQHTAGVRVLGEIALSELDLAEDAESLGYSVMAKGVERKFSKSGIVRRTQTGYGFVPNKSLFKKLFKKAKEAEVYTLTGDAELLAQIAKRVDRKALVKGTVDKDNLVTVTSIKGLADLGFLKNWFSKGKIVGVIKDSAGVPMSDVKVEARSSEGFVYSDMTDADGTFEVKSLTAGAYSVKFSKEGYGDETSDGTVNKRKALNLEVGMTATAAAAE